MIPPNPVPPLLPGDILLYDSGSLVDTLIKFRTWSDVAHVEIKLGLNFSGASRPGMGVHVYSTRFDGLKYVRRPLIAFDLVNALNVALALDGTSYGWGDLGRFYLLNLPTKGLICSQYGDLLLRGGDVIAFAEDYPPGAVSPRDFLVTPLAKTIWQAKPRLALAPKLL